MKDRISPSSGTLNGSGTYISRQDVPGPSASRQVRGREELRRAAMLRRLLVGVRELDQQRLAPRAADERDPDRQAERIARRHGDRRIAGDGRRRACSTRRSDRRSRDRSATPGCRSARPARPDGACRAPHRSLLSATAAHSSRARRGTPCRSAAPSSAPASISSWPKNGISRARLASLNAMTSAREWTRADGPSAPRYALRSALNSYSSTSSSLASYVPAFGISAGSTMTAPSAFIRSIAAFAIRSVDVAVAEELRARHADARAAQAVRRRATRGSRAGVRRARRRRLIARIDA